MTPQEAQRSARLATFKATLRDLDRVDDWLTVNGYVNAERGYPQTAAVMYLF